MTPLDKAVVAILDKNERICGTGFLAAERLILTCAHVVDAAREAGDVIRGRLHVETGTHALTLLADGWFPAQDVAILQWADSLPTAVQPLPVGHSSHSAGHDFVTLGYPLLGDYQGIPARGKIDGTAPKADGQRMLKLSSADIAQGHSGAPLFDETLQRVVGMVSEVFHPTATTKHRDAAFAIPMETIWELFPAIKPRPNPVNPFYAGGRINDPDHFFGRQRLLREVKSLLQARSNVSIIGESQVGKSSLLYHLYNTRSEWETKARVLFVDLQGVWDVEDFCATILEKLGHTGNQPRALRQALLQTETILLLDEIEQLADSAFTPKLLSLLRSVAQEKQIALCISSQRPLGELFPASTNHVSPFHNVFSVRELLPFTEDEARAFLNARLLPTGVQFSDAEVQRLLQESKGHPGQLQRLARQLYRQYVE